MDLKNKKILIVSPHIDDEAICAGGLIMLAEKQLAEVFVLYIANGASRQFIGVNGQVDVNARLEEAKQAARYANFKYTIVFEDDQITRLDTLPQKDLIEVIEDTNREFKPDIVVIPYRNSFNQDHRAVATAAITAFRPIPEDLQQQPKIILEMEEPYSWGTAPPFQPNFYIDISDIMHKKLVLYNCYKTQVADEPHSRSPENLIRLAGLRGSEISKKYAEAFNLVKGQLWT